jgi:hypothetical protein
MRQPLAEFARGGLAFGVHPGSLMIDVLVHPGGASLEGVVEYVLSFNARWAAIKMMIAPSRIRIANSEAEFDDERTKPGTIGL